MAYRRNGRSPRAVAIAEGAASLALLLPLVFTMVFTIMEVIYAYFLKSSIFECARRAARDMAIAYGVTPTVYGSRATQDLMVFNNMRLANVVSNSAQFDNAVFRTSSDPAAVTVNLRYLSNQCGLPAIPYPDPLMPGSSFQIAATSTCRLEYRIQSHRHQSKWRRQWAGDHIQGTIGKSSVLGDDVPSAPGPNPGCETFTVGPVKLIQ
jgi:hypothetical protein